MAAIISTSVVIRVGQVQPLAIAVDEVPQLQCTLSIEGIHCSVPSLVGAGL
jgi:hypothetical protein